MTYTPGDVVGTLELEAERCLKRQLRDEGLVSSVMRSREDREVGALRRSFVDYCQRGMRCQPHDVVGN